MLFELIWARGLTTCLGYLDLKVVRCLSLILLFQDTSGIDLLTPFISFAARSKNLSMAESWFKRNLAINVERVTPIGNSDGNSFLV